MTEHECKPSKYELEFKCADCGIVLLALELDSQSMNDVEKNLVKALIKFKEELDVQ